jgi:Tfp pilus assembly ATPase PilU
MNPYASKLYTRIQERNKRQTVTADSLFENKTWKATEKILNALHELQAEGLITTKSITIHGKFATELIPKEGYKEHKKVIEKIEEKESVPQKKRKYQKRKVKRGVII